MSTTSSRPQVLVLGAGAIGAFYGALLAKPADSSAVCRSNYPAVAKSGFQLKSPTYGSWTWTPSHTFPNSKAAAASGVKWDYVVITTKALPDISDDSTLLDGLISEKSAIVLIQNGLGVEAPYTRRFPGTIVLSGVTIASASQPSPGKIDHARWTRINVGPYQASSGATNEEEGQRRAEHFCELLRQGGVKDAEAYSARKLQLLRWHKIAINASMNPSSVLSGGTANGAMAVDEELGRHLLGVMKEVLEVAPKVCGEDLPKSFATAERILESTRKNTSGSRPSMWADWEGGKAMELEVIMGEPIRAAREKGLEMPRLESMYALLKMAQKNRDRAKSKL